MLLGLVFVLWIEMEMTEREVVMVVVVRQSS